MAGLRSLNHSACYAPEGAPSTPCLFQGWSNCMDLLSLACGMLCLPPWRPQCHCQLKHHMQVNFKPSFPAAAADPTSGDLTRHLRACARCLGQVVPDPAFSFVVFLSSNDGRTWARRAFCKTSLFKKTHKLRPSLLFISKEKIYNPLSALMLTLVCNLGHVFLKVAIFILNVAIAADFLRRQTGPQKLFWGNLPM